MARGVVGLSFGHVFVIGAMKAGTTTLYDDLSQHPDISLAEKEYDGLRRFDTSTVAGRRAYRQGLGAGSVTVDVTASYSMTPHLPDVAGSAAAVAPDAAIVYLVREPVARIVSHHHHDLSTGVVSADVDKAVKEDTRLIDYTRYAAQLRKWLDAFPASSTRVIKFEDYIENRRGETDKLLEWLGLSTLPDDADLDRVSNRTEGRVAARGRMRSLLHSDTYRHRIRPLVPRMVRSRAAQAVLTATPERPNPPSADTVERILGELSPDLSALREATGVAWEPGTSARRTDDPLSEGGGHG